MNLKLREREREIKCRASAFPSRGLYCKTCVNMSPSTAAVRKPGGTGAPLLPFFGTCFLPSETAGLQRTRLCACGTHSGIPFSPLLKALARAMMVANFINLTQSRIPRASMKNCLSRAVLITVIEVGSPIRCEQCHFPGVGGEEDEHRKHTFAFPSAPDCDHD